MESMVFMGNMIPWNYGPNSQPNINISVNSQEYMEYTNPVMYSFTLLFCAPWLYHGFALSLVTKCYLDQKKYWGSNF